MVTCKECGETSPAGSLFCEECGAFLLDRELPVDPAGAEAAPITEVARSMDYLPQQETPFYDEADTTPPPSLLGQTMEDTASAQQITFVIPISGRRLSLKISDEIRVGRADPAHGYYPELDLTHDGGAQKGVSRVHAAVRRSNRGILLVDLTSTNGTSLNNFRVPPELPYPIRSGDEIRFGQLLVHVFLD